MIIRKLFHLFYVKKLYVLAFLLVHWFSFAQKLSQKFTHYGKQEGLNQSSVNFIFQDSRDYLWIANFGGINKFDGYDFTSYVNEFGNSSSIPDNSVWVILETHDKALWFGTKRGLSRYNPKEDNFANYYIREDDKSLGTLAVKAIFEDSKKRLYIGSEGEGLYEFSTKTKTFSIIKAIPKEAKVSAITEDQLGNLWVGTENLGLFKISENRTESTSLKRKKSFTSETIWSLHADKQGDIWIGTDVDGLVRYNITTDDYVFYKNSKDTYEYKAGDKIKCIVQGDNNTIWIGSATKGLSYFSYKENRFYSYVKNPFDKNSLFDNDVSSIFYGANNVLYVGFYTNGFDKLIQSPFQILRHNPEHENTLSNDNVYSMYLDTDGFLWFGTYGGGLNRYDPETGVFKHYTHDEKDVNSISHDWVRVIYEVADGTMWIGTWGGGLNKFDKNKETFTRYFPKVGQTNSLNHNIITALYQDTDGELWIGTYGGGINIYQPETDDFRSIVHDRKDPHSISDDHITSFYQDRNGKIWICTYGGGLNVYDKNTDKFERFLPDSEKKYSLNNHKTLHIYDVPEEDFFWITTLGGGINKFYYKENRFLNYTEKDGLSNNSTMGMLKDSKNTYWISSNNGLSRFDPSKETFTNYTQYDGLASDDYNLEAYAKTKDGILYFGGKKGVTYFNPKDVKLNSVFPNLAFTSIKVEDSIFNFIPQKLKLPYGERITIEYAAINPDKINNISYAYQLVGRDDDWQIMEKNRYLEFANLDHGAYQLHVRSTNGDGAWSEEYASISLYVPPPWYMTWYFRLGILLIILGSIYSYYKLKINQVKKRNRLLEKEVKKRTKTIQKKNVALELAKEKTEKAYQQLKKLEGFKGEFISMLAHDLKNPLVTILGYSSGNVSDSNLQSINKSGKTMLNLIENMLEVQKFENAEVKLKLNSYNLKNITTEATNQVKLQAAEKRIRILNNINPKYVVNIDKEIIERVFINLLTNAIKFSDTDSKIEISEKEENIDSDTVIIFVKDNGAGIPEALMSSIFTKFSQVEARDSGSIRSTGLGLTFCKMALEVHGGKIWVESEIEKGSTFFFTLPKLEDSVISLDQTYDENSTYENPLYNLVFEAKDFKVLKPFKEKINTLTMYEMGEWLDIFDKVSEGETVNIKKWKNMMMEALTSFDKNAFSHLKNTIFEAKIDKKTQ